MSKITPGSWVKFFKLIIPEYIGTYTYKDGFTTDAISIDNVPNDVKVDGFEIIIPGFPKLPQGLSLNSVHYTHREERWEIDFINHDSFKRANLGRKGEFFEMIDKITLNVPRTAYGVGFCQGDPVTSLQRYRLTIKHSDLYRTFGSD